MKAKTTQLITASIKIGAVALLFGLLIWVVAWLPVIDRLARPCHYYPNAFADCRDVTR